MRRVTLPHWLSLWLAIALAGGCASLGGEIDPPTVSIASIRTLPGTGAGQRFEIVLNIANPNKQPLDIVGLAYTIEIMGRDLVTGVSNEVPELAPYTEQQVTLTAGVDFLQLLRLFTDLGLSQEAPQALEYRFKAKIDFEGLVPTQRVEESGVIDLAPRG